jgi:hypothetical protein
VKLKLAILLLVAGTIIFSCKKEDKQPASTANTGGGGGGGGNNPTPSSATTFFGIFTTGSYTTVMSSTATPFSNESARAYFSNQSTQYSNSSTAVTVNKVFLNGDSLNYNSSLKYYTDYFNVSLATESWSVNGANGIGTFTIDITTITPSAASINFQDSISISAGFSIVVNNVSNITKGYLLVLDGTNTVNGFVSKTLNTGNNTITFSAADLANLTPTQSGYLALSLTNAKAYSISGKDYQFNREAQCSMHIKIKP